MSRKHYYEDDGKANEKRKKRYQIRENESSAVLQRRPVAKSPSSLVRTVSHAVKVLNSVCPVEQQIRAGTLRSVTPNAHGDTKHCNTECARGCTKGCGRGSGHEPLASAAGCHFLKKDEGFTRIMKLPRERCQSCLHESPQSPLDGRKIPSEAERPL